MANLRVGKLIRGWRLARSYSVARLAREAGVGTTTIERIEVGADLKLGTLVALVRALRIDEDGVRAILEAAGVPLGEAPAARADESPAT